MKTALIIISVLIVVAFFFFLLKGLEIAKRKKENDSTDIDTLTPRKLRKTLHIVAPGNNQVKQILEIFKDYDTRITHQTDSEAIFFIGDASSSKFNGIFKTQPEDMPMRIIIKLTGKQGNQQVQLTMEEDYGFQSFFGPAKKAFVQKYHEGFDFFGTLLQKKFS